MKYFLPILLALCFLRTEVFAQNDAPAPWDAFLSDSIGSAGALTAAFTIEGVEFPGADHTDWVAALDGDDATVLLGVARADDNGTDVIAALSINPPYGVSGTFHLAYYDHSTSLFHILTDDMGDPLEIPHTESEDPGAPTFIMGFEISNTGTFPGEGTLEPPGSGDFDEIATLLPVELTNFSGTFNGKGIDLGWATASEEGNDYFAVERSADGAIFREISRVDGRNTAADYTFTDEQPATGFNYYRLRQTDLNGEFAFSEVVQVFAPGATVSVSGVYPNPTANSFSLRLSGEWGEAVTVSLLDASGRTLRTWTRSATALTELDVHTVNAGAYQVVATDGKQTAATRLVVNR